MLEQEIQKRLNRSRRKASKLFSFTSKPIPETTRVKIINSYSSEINQVDLSGDLAQMMATVNQPYENRLQRGLFYADDYCKLYHKPEPWWTISGLANSRFWDISKSGSFFCKRAEVSASQALAAFWAGPTFPDCANVIQAAMYQLILNQVGVDDFDKIFNNPISQFLITKWLYQPFDSTSKENPTGNPLYFLFDQVEKLSPGDICYIKGVKDYQYKHLTGFAPGWNLICVSAGDEPTFIGFGPDTFETPLTMDQLRIKLIEFYNQEQSKETKLKIKQYKPKIGSSSVGDFDQVKIDLANKFADDVKPLDSEIVGLQIIIRLNPEKLRQFLQKKLTPETVAPPLHGIISKIKKKGKSRSKSKKKGNKIIFSVGLGENQNSTFKNYQQDTEDKTILFNHFLKFALAVQHQTYGNYPLGLFVSGKAGIGKTHLSNAVMNALVGKNILYVDEDYISQEFQAKAVMPDFKQWLHQIDLIILDDINTYYGSASTFFKASLEYIFKNNKCLLVTSNHPLDLLTTSLPRYINYIDPILNNLTVINEFNMMSFRTKWIDSIINLDNPLQRLIDQVGLAAVVIIDSPQTAVKYQKIIQQQTKKKVRIALDPYRNGVVFDLYMYDLYQYSYFIVEVFSKPQAEQLVNLVNHVHHNNKKILVITDSIEEFKQRVLQIIYNDFNKKYLIRRVDRLRILFPGVL